MFEKVAEPEEDTRSWWQQFIDYAEDALGVTDKKLEEWSKGAGKYISKIGNAFSKVGSTVKDMFTSISKVMETKINQRIDEIDKAVEALKKSSEEEIATKKASVDAELEARKAAADEELKTLTQAKTKIWLVQCETDMVVATDECAKRIWKIITEGREVSETHFEGDRGIASGFTTYETADDRLKLTLYETKDSKFAIAEDYDQDGVYTKSEYMDHWSWCFTLRNNPEAKNGEHIWQWAAK